MARARCSGPPSPGRPLSRGSGHRHSALRPGGGEEAVAGRDGAKGPSFRLDPALDDSAQITERWSACRGGGGGARPLAVRSEVQGLPGKASSLPPDLDRNGNGSA